MIQSSSAFLNINLGLKILSSAGKMVMAAKKHVNMFIETRPPKCWFAGKFEV
jgi:hypothetical protein